MGFTQRVSTSDPQVVTSSPAPSAPPIRRGLATWYCAPPTYGQTWAVLSQLPAGADGRGGRQRRPTRSSRSGPRRASRGLVGQASRTGSPSATTGGRRGAGAGCGARSGGSVTQFVQAEPGGPAALGTASPAQALGDTLFATGRDFSTGHPVVLASVDGEAWDVRHAFDSFAFSKLAVGTSTGRSGSASSLTRPTASRRWCGAPATAGGRRGAGPGRVRRSRGVRTSGRH